MPESRSLEEWVRRCRVQSHLPFLIAIPVKTDMTGEYAISVEMFHPPTREEYPALCINCAR